MKTNTKTILLFIMSFALIGFISFTYAYFSSDIVNNNVKDQVVETGTLSLRYVDGPEINMQNIKPGSTITKTVYGANTGTLDAKYNLVWQELVNEIISDEMVIEAECTRMDATTESESGSCNSIATKPIKDENIKKNITIEPSIVHKYDITITFKETNEAQNYNQGKKFSGVLGVTEFKLPEPIYCTFDGEMVQGAEYVNGQYTYRYMQEGAYSSSDLSWTNIEEDGWGVQLTDKTSTEPVTSKLCTHINNKPVTSMRNMFDNSAATTLDLSSFDTSNVTNMRSMFSDSNVQTLDLSNFNTSKVTDMGLMFYRSAATTLDLSSFDTSNVTSMFEMFENSAATTLDLSSFDTNNVTNMSYMFSYSKATTIDLSSFDTSNVTNMDSMFYGSTATTLDLSSFDTSNVTNIHGIFWNSAATTLDVSKFDTSKVTDMSSMFEGSTATTLDLSSFDTSKVTNMSRMFDSSAATTIDLSSFDTSNVTVMFYMFAQSAATILDLSNFDTSKVTDMGWMFYSSAATTLDLSSFNTSNVTNMIGMFRNSNVLKTIYAGDNFNTNAVTSSSNMFYNTTNLVGGAGTKYNASHIDKTYARIDGGTSLPGYFTLKNN